MTWIYVKRIRGKVYICNISTSNRRYIRQVKKVMNVADRFIDPLPSEIDNHADTTCFGKNFRVISFMSEVCTVSPYMSEYDLHSDIPMCTAATAVDLDQEKLSYSSSGKAYGLGKGWNIP